MTSTCTRGSIDADLLEQAQVHRVDDREARNLLNINGKAGDFSGVFYPYISPVTGYRVTGRLRLDHPPLKSDGAPDGKYRTPYGDNRHLFFPPAVGDMLTDASIPVVIVESEKAALAIMAAAGRAGRRVLSIACGGCWAWRGKTGKAEDANGARVDVKGPLSDFSLVTWTRRAVVVLFDGRPNDDVRAARRHLARELRERSADVRHGHLPDDDHRVNGPDDLVAAQGDEALWRIIDGATAEDFKRRITRAGDEVVIADDLDNIRLALTGWVWTHASMRSPGGRS